MFVFVGLGNPDAKYRYTRHNSGFLALDFLAERLGITFGKRLGKSMVGEGRVGTQRVVLAKPLTYMNNSGEAVVELINWYKIDPAEELVVIYDDIDLPAGEIRVRSNGGSGTHNGMRSIIYLTGTESFPRIRVGIGKPLPEWDLAAYVLSVFSEEEKETIKKGLENAADAAQLILKDGISAAQQKYNVKKRKKDEPAETPKAEQSEAADTKNA
jgi:PTH1 family peptidyl-tRNA hydrolase